MDREQDRRPTSSGLAGGSRDLQTQYKDQPLLTHPEEIEPAFPGPLLGGRGDLGEEREEGKHRKFKFSMDRFFFSLVSFKK